MLGDGRHNLSRTATISYDCDTLVSVVALVVPFCCVEDLPFERSQPGEIRLPWSGKAPDGGQQDGAFPRQLLLSGRVDEFNFPLSLLG